MKMKRTNLYLPADLLARLKALAKKDGRSMVWHVRRAIAEYLERKEQP